MRLCFSRTANPSLRFFSTLLFLDINPSKRALHVCHFSAPGFVAAGLRIAAGFPSSFTGVPDVSSLDCVPVVTVDSVIALLDGLLDKASSSITGEGVSIPFRRAFSRLATSLSDCDSTCVTMTNWTNTARVVVRTLSSPIEKQNGATNL
jgi:hypothetical protein